MLLFYHTFQQILHGLVAGSHPAGPQFDYCWQKKNSFKFDKILKNLLMIFEVLKRALCIQNGHF